MFCFYNKLKASNLELLEIHILFIMPQLDALTYFSQYVMLVITFGAVYYFVILFIIPSTASALKLRSKLNSSKHLKEKFIHDSSDHLTVDLVESNIGCDSWYSNISVDRKFSLVQTGMWLQSASTMQRMECILAKKKLCLALLIPFRPLAS